MVGRIFINYRREDSEGWAGWLFDRLLTYFSTEQLFMDITIEPGLIFTKVIDEQVATCKAFIAVIGKRWLSIVDDEGQLRLNNEDDFVRIEIEAALKRDIRVIPLLVEGAKMPRREKLPESLKSLTVRNGISVTNIGFAHEVAKLAALLKPLIEVPSPRKPDQGSSTTDFVPANRPKESGKFRWSIREGRPAIATDFHEPPYRQLRVYAYDPLLAAKFDDVINNEALLEVPWESKLGPGPIGEYLEIIDVDPASQCCYEPVDLNSPDICANLGLAPSEASPQFHQQMAYAVSMKTIEYFERALGRKVLWAPREVRAPGDVGVVRIEYVQRLRIYPHALRAKNAYYSPEHKALLLGYFKSPGPATEKGRNVVFMAASHDVVAHETAHALLDGVRRRFREATNPDVFAFHEAFADIVALFQHFSLPEAVLQQIAATRGDLEQQNLLGRLAVQFGVATNRYGALRNYLGEVRRLPNESDYEDAHRTGDLHVIGAVLVAAVFDAFLIIYKRRMVDVLRLVTEAGGLSRESNISTDLVDRLASEASKVARHVLNMCIRALDYCPPVDIVLGEYLRALITADADLVPNDRLAYRSTFIEAFRKRGIYPRDVKHLSPQSLRWEAPPLPLQQAKVMKVLKGMSTDWDLNSKREDAYKLSNENARTFWHWLMDKDSVSDEELSALGLLRIDKPQPYRIGTYDGELRRIEVHSVRPVRRAGPDGNIRSDLVVEITQSFQPAGIPGARFRGGCTLIIDLATAEVRYMVRKKVDSPWRLNYQLAFAATESDLGNNYFVNELAAREPFAKIHHVHG